VSCAAVRRFRWVAIRVFLARMVHAAVAAVQWLLSAVVYRLDYARRFRRAPRLPGPSAARLDACGAAVVCRRGSRGCVFGCPLPCMRGSRPGAAFGLRRAALCARRPSSTYG